MPSPIKQVIRWILLFHGLANIAQGVYSVLYPSNFASTAGPGFMSASPMAIQSIGIYLSFIPSPIFLQTATKENLTFLFV